MKHLGNKSLQTRTKLQKSIKEVLNCCKLQVIFKSQKNSIIIFASKTLIPIFLHQVWFANISMGFAMNSISENVLDILVKEVVNKLYFTFKQ